VAGAFYASSFVSEVFGIIPGLQKYAYYSAPYNENLVLSFLDSAGAVSDGDARSIELLYRKNPDVNLQLARTMKTVRPAESVRLYKQAVSADPLNASTIHEVASYFLDRNDSADLLWVVLLMIRPNRDAPEYRSYITANWSGMKDCFSKDFFGLTELRSENYQAKVFYRAGLCLVSSGAYSQARELLRLSVALKSNWSNIYIDDAAFEYWKFGDTESARRILSACLAIPFTRKHCSYYGNNELPTASITEPSVLFGAPGAGQ
jgi:tetratricopeptide (TPR) repeat protein